jgi:hypothetical protein
MPFQDAVMSGSSKQFAVPSAHSQEVAFVVVHCEKYNWDNTTVKENRSSSFFIFKNLC